MKEFWMAVFPIIMTVSSLGAMIVNVYYKCFGNMLYWFGSLTICISMYIMRGK